MEKWARIKYTPNLPLGENRTYVTASKEHIDLSCEAACEGLVLLKNEDDTLPIQKGSRVALFGKGIFDYVKGGGEAVMLPFLTSVTSTKGSWNLRVRSLFLTNQPSSIATMFQSNMSRGHFPAC